MRAVVQRVRQASVESEGITVGSIGQGLMVLLGAQTGDTSQDVEYIVKKIAGLRVFDDEQGVPNRSVTEINGEVLLVSQFTLLADARHGRRPSYIQAARPEDARPLYQLAIETMKTYVPVETGIFQADMQVSLQNDGPMTILLDSKKEF